MRTEDFSFELPDELIARFPTEQRRASRLLTLNKNSGAVAHSQFVDLPSFLKAGDLLVFNNTRVVPARLFGCKASGGKIEFLLERMLDEKRVLAHIRASKAPKPGSELWFSRDGAEPFLARATLLARHDALFELAFDAAVLPILEDIGHMPLPPYIDRSDELSDRERYQTVYAQHPGAVAAPTAGLHFDEAMLDELRGRGVETAFVTLHVGAGTFQPVRVADVREHKMHAEYAEVSAEVCEQVRATKARGGRVVAVGTTAVRGLESAAMSGEIAPFASDTAIFIYPGYEFKVVDALLTNFHLPESTLLMLISAMAGREWVLSAYNEAVREGYRFFSYGDAMFISGETP